jgi:DNA-binding MarR family transcriptional regulator
MGNEQAYEITWLIRRVFRGMAAAAEQYLEDSGLSAADRAVMEFLYPSTQLSVPDIARRYQVSRQHVQVTVNNLLQRGLLRSVDNPKHKRSRLIRLSELGRESFAEIQRNEETVVRELFADIPEKALSATLHTLQSLHEKLK